MRSIFAISKSCTETMIRLLQIETYVVFEKDTRHKGGQRWVHGMSIACTEACQKALHKLKWYLAAKNQVCSHSNYSCL